MARRSAGPQPYDFRRPIKLSREHVRMLQIAFETYARSCGTLLTTRLRAVSQLSLVSIEQVTYDEYLGQVGNPTLMSVVSLDPLPGSMLMEMPLTTALGSIDHMLGGPGGEQAERQLTDVELPLMKDLLKKMLDELRYSFEQVVEINPKVTTIEYNPQFLRTLSPGDAVVVATLEVKIGEIETLSTICLPFTTILPVLQADNAEGELSAAEQAARDLSRRNLTFGMASAPIEVAVRFTPITMRANDIVNLSVGDVVPLSHPASVPLAVTVNDTTFAHAVPGNQGSRLACLVVPPPKESLA
ncbi:flagellar motor switch protein FliM [Pilimelia columellifera subsp. columellifera]|uniref:Flagellar motor switch protein FliM n=2 Tax=Pilimelia TaxID=53370 RepID=A0ABP6AJA3_9ACTN